jgi:transcription termination factor NusB
LFAAQLKKDEPLPSVEDKLRVLDAALVALEQPGLSIAETTRLNKIILGVKVYQQLFTDFVKYSELEAEVVEVRRHLAAEKNQK